MDGHSDDNTNLENTDYCNKIHFHKKNVVLGILYHKQFFLLPDIFQLQAFKNAFKDGRVNFANLMSLPSIVKKVRTESKSSQET